MSTEEPGRYIAILKASYDYSPQSDDEIAIREDQLLLLVERVDEDWWKVKLTGNEVDTENQIGLVPAAYVEQAPHLSVVKALYDYEAVAPGELSVQENDILLVFETEEDWLLVQDSQVEGRAGYVPGNYVEVTDEEVNESTATPNRIVVPDSPPKPAYVDPADMVASVKVTADDIKTWSVSEIDKKGKKKKGTLGIGNGSLFFASESDKTPVQKWEIKDVASASSEKAKHVKIDIDGPSAANLHFHTSLKDHAEAILEKLSVSRALSTQETERLAITTSPSSPTKKPSVHFSPAAPTIIPDPEEPEEPEEEEEQVKESQEIVQALYDFNADGEDELTVKEGERLIVLEKDGEEWWKCKNAYDAEGVVPASYLEVMGQSDGLSNEDAEAEARRADEERLRKELEEENRERVRREREQEEENRRSKTAVALKVDVQSKVKETTTTTQPEGLKRKMTAPPVTFPETSQPAGHDRRTSSDVNRPSPENTRTWHDRTGQFRVEAAFLGFNNGKLRLHKVNGVIVEVPSEKMSLDDMQYVEKLIEKKTKASATNHGASDDDIPLALAKNAKTTSKASNSSKKAHIDWFDFFLSAGCEVDDCTRYSAAFERDKIDETLLNDITEGVMRSLGLREGDIIRVKKAIEKRKPTDNLQKQSPYLLDQIRQDEELARQLQAQENATGPTLAPNLFAGPGGVLKPPRRGRPQPSKTLPPTNVDLTAISSASSQIKNDEPPRIGSASPLPPRPSSASAPTTSGFEDDAWTNRPSSTKPSKSTAPSNVAASSLTSPPSISSMTPTPPKPEASQTVQASNQVSKGTSKLVNTTESDIFDQLARLSDLRQSSTPQAPQQAAPKPALVQPPGFQTGMGMRSSPLSLGQLTNSTIVSPSPVPTSNGPRGPYAPVPANQGLLQPLIPTQTGFGGFIPTKPTQTPSFQNQLSPPFIPPQATGFHNPSPIVTQPSGAFGNFGGVPFQGTPDNFAISGLGRTSHPTGLNSQIILSPFSNSGAHSPSPAPSNAKDTSPASVFAQMKLGTFANEDNGLNGQTASWGHQPYQAYMGH